MRNRFKQNKPFILLTIIVVCLVSIIVFSNRKITKEYNISRDKDFGSIMLNTSIEDFNKDGFSFGDSLNIELSNGVNLIDVPYYDGYYEKTGELVVVAYPGYKQVYVTYCSGISVFDDLNVSEDDIAKVSINTRGKYLATQQAAATHYSDSRDDYDSDISFSNFRSISAGNMKENTFYRGASPIDDEHNRSSITDKLIKQAGINFVLNLSDNENEINGYLYDDMNKNDYFYMELLNNDNVALLDLNTAYQSDEYAEKLVQGVLKMMNKQGPYYIHCLEGKDRTGFVCVLFESLCNASYEELEADYMTTYDNYYGINKNENVEKYDIFRRIKFDDIYDYLTKDSETAYEGAVSYLIRGGMSQEQVLDFVEFLSK